jgi:hypothetical protein
MFKKHTRRNNAKSEVLTAVLIEIQVFRYMTPCWVVHSCRCFRGTCCLYNQGLCRPWRWGQWALPKRQWVSQSQKRWIWTKEPAGVSMRRYEGNIEVDPKTCSRIGCWLNSPVMTRYTLMNCLSAYKQQIHLLVQYQLSKVLVPLSQYEFVRHWHHMPPRANRLVCASWSTIPWRRAAPKMSPRYRHSAIKVTSTNLVTFFQAAYFRYKLHIQISYWKNKFWLSP